jgi:hypothetical protein
LRARATALVALAALAAGCGGDDDAEAELAERANPICERANASLAALARPRSLEQLLRYVDEATEVFETRRRDLRALTPPDGREDEWTAFFAADDRALAALATLRESTVNGRGGEEAIQAFETAAADAREQADALGLETCAEPPPEPPDELEVPAPPATTAAPPAAASTWAERADAICAEAQGRIDALPAPTDQQDAAAQVAQVAGIVRAEIGELRELEARRADRARVERFLGALGRGANSLDRLQQAMLVADEEAVDRFLGEGQAAADDAQREADALGLTICGRG